MAKLIIKHLPSDDLGQNKRGKKTSVVTEDLNTFSVMTYIRHDIKYLHYSDMTPNIIYNAVLTK